MVDDKSNRGSADEGRVSTREVYEVIFFARKHGISKEHAKRIIEQYGPDRDACDRAAQGLE